MTENSETARANPEAFRPLFVVALVFPLLKSVLGIDGGAIFQIIALEDLGLDATAIGVAFGLGTLSVPLQVWAARMPMWRARQSLRRFFLVAASLCFLLALLVTFVGAGTRAAGLGLVVTVLAEVSLSVLFITAWQPLLYHALSEKGRQVVNSRARAGGGVLLAVALLVFGSAPTTVRVGLLFVTGLATLGLVWLVRNVSVPPRPAR